MIIFSFFIQGLYWVSSGVSGLSMNAAKAITQGIFGDSNQGEKIGVIVYFGIAVVLIIITIMY